MPNGGKRTAIAAFHKMRKRATLPLELYRQTDLWLQGLGEDRRKFLLTGAPVRHTKTPPPLFFDTQVGH
jgi:hypothetical protein